MFRRMILCLLLFYGSVQAATFEEAVRLYESERYEEASTLLLQLAEAGDDAAQQRLSIMYFYGRGVPEDESRAMLWARRSAASGNPDAMYFIGTMYVFGDKIPETVSDPDLEAAKWLFEAASRGHADAEYGLGLMFLAGKGLVQDHAQALKWIRRAAENGHAGALSFISSRGAR